MADQLYAYTGWEQRTYGSYLTPSDGGGIRTLVGSPGMDPVAVLRATGNETLPEYPGDGMWILVQPEPVKSSRKAAAAPAAEDATA